MKSIDLIRWALQMTDEGTANLVKELRDAPLTQPTPRGGNHPIWVLGHLAFLEAGLPGIIRGDVPNPLAHWAPLFGTGTECTTDAKAYPNFDEVLKAYREGRARTLKLLDEIGEAGLDAKPKQIPPGFEEPMETMGRAFLLLALHNMVHYGQVADARRAAGLKALI